MEGLGSWYLYFLSGIKILETRPLINTLHIFLEGCKRSLQKQSSVDQDSLIHAKGAKFSNLKVGSCGCFKASSNKSSESKWLLQRWT